MIQIKDFIKKLKMPILWTVGYIFVLWLIYITLFNFDIFNAHAWIRVSRAHIHGFGGFVFSLLTLAAIPLYIATTSIVIRTQKPIVALPVPKFISNTMEKLFPKQKTPDAPSESPSPDESVSDTDITDSLNDIPSEMRGFFLRARAHPNRVAAPICNVCATTPNVYPTAPTQPSAPDNDMPLPPDFDLGDTPNITEPQTPFTGAPIFQDINFYDESPEPATPNTATAPATPSAPDDTDDTDTNPVAEYLTSANRQFSVISNDIALTDNAAIAVHDDPDFWIMDEPTWFAAGQTRESPIPGLLATAHEHNVRAVLYLGATNIMNFDAKRAEWESKGIHVITKLEDL